MKIDFIPTDKETEIMVPPPEPAKLFVPDWYKNTPRYSGTKKPEFNSGEVTNNTVKACYPFYDALTSGYLQKTWCDIHISFSNNSFKYDFSSMPDIISHREDVSVYLPKNFWNAEFIWKMRWMPKLPDGWSVLLINPMNRMNLPFESLSAIIDSDTFHTFPVPGSYPFYVKKEYNDFIIPAGTPMYQIIPIKREKWKSSYINFDSYKAQKMGSYFKKFFIGSYKRNFRSKKEFL